MNIFNRLVEREHQYDTTVGVTTPLVMDRRFVAFAAMTNGRGFRQPPKELRTDAKGLTRGGRKRLARVFANVKVSEFRTPEFMHSAARRAAA